jgi:hypothetical protein
MQEQNGKNSILQYLQKHYKPTECFVIEEKIPNPDTFLEDVMVYKNTKKGQAHWHYLTLGLSELYDKETELAEISGFGIELSFRLACGVEKTPPVWVKHFLENLVSYVFNSSESFEEYQCLDAGGVICQDVETKLTAIAFVEDKQLKNLETPNGKLTFLQVIGLTNKELEIFASPKYKEWLNKFTKNNELGITDLLRQEILT